LGRSTSDVCNIRQRIARISNDTKRPTLPELRIPNPIGRNTNGDIAATASIRNGGNASLRGENSGTRKERIRRRHDKRRSAPGPARHQVRNRGCCRSLGGAALNYGDFLAAADRWCKRK
jgi:hypothetical protein